MTGPGAGERVATRRDALKLGGLTVSLGAIIAACGNGRGGDDAPGRVGNAPVLTTPEDLPVDDAVLLRTAASLERTAADLYDTALDLDVFGSSQVTLIERLIENGHAYAADDGAVYFSITSFPEYGKLKGIDTSTLIAGARVERDEGALEHRAQERVAQIQ